MRITYLLTYLLDEASEKSLDWLFNDNNNDFIQIILTFYYYYYCWEGPFWDAIQAP